MEDHLRNTSTFVRYKSDVVWVEDSPLYMSDEKKDTCVTGQVLEVVRDSRPVLHLHQQPVGIILSIVRLGH